MFSLASNFWPLLWTIFGVGALLTVIAGTVLGVAGRRHTSQPATVTVALNARHDHDARAAA